MFLILDYLKMVTFCFDARSSSPGAFLKPLFLSPSSPLGGKLNGLMWRKKLYSLIIFFLNKLPTYFNITCIRSRCSQNAINTVLCVSCLKNCRACNKHERIFTCQKLGSTSFCVIFWVLLGRVAEKNGPTDFSRPLPPPFF